jgi:tRNA(adenine34) deaminase
LKAARRGLRAKEIPIGAVLVKSGEVISTAHNSTEKRNLFLAHAEMLCIEQATKKLKTKFLYDCELYVTLAPCKMCLAAARLSRIKSIHYLAPSKKFGSRGPGYFKTRLVRSRSQLTQQAIDLLRDFFKDKR